MAEITTETPVLQQLLTRLQQSTDEEVAEMRVLLGMDAPKPKVTTQVFLSAAERGEKPEAEDYRLNMHHIDYDSCLGRRMDESDQSKDTRWSPAVYREYQCGKPVQEGCDLCPLCIKREEKYIAKPKAGNWVGRVTEEVPGWAHILGTEWAEFRKPAWTGIGNNPFKP